MNPVLVASAVSVVRGLVAMDTRKKYEKKTGTPRPPLLSRRAIGTTLMSASMLMAAFTGVQVPEGDINTIVDLGYQAVELVKQNKEFGITVWGAVTTLIGYFKRKK